MKQQKSCAIVLRAAVVLLCCQHFSPAYHFSMHVYQKQAVIAQICVSWLENLGKLKVKKEHVWARVIISASAF